MLKKTAALLLCLLMIVFSACSAPTPSDEMQMPADAPVDEPAHLRVNAPWLMNRDDYAFYESLNTFLHQQGFALSFGIDAELASKYANYTAYEQAYLEQAINDMDGDAAYIIYHAEIERFLGDGRCRDVYAQAASIAPTYAQRAASQINREAQAMHRAPLNIKMLPHHRLAVLVHNDTYAQYGGDIRTMSQYRAYLERIKADKPDAIPGAMTPYINDTSEGSPGFTAMALFMPEWGYTAVDSAFILRLPNPYYGLFAELGTDRIVPGATMPELAAAYKELIRLHTDGLVDLWHGTTLQSTSGARFSLADYPTMLVCTCNIDSDYDWHRFYTNTPLGRLDLTQYHMSVLYSDLLPRIAAEEASFGKYGVVFAARAESREFLRLMEWLEQPENYHLFRYGVEGEDYTQDADGKITFTEDCMAFRKLSGSASMFFQFPDMEIKADSPLPVNYRDELNAITYPYTLEVLPDAARQLSSDLDTTAPALENFLAESFGAFNKLHEDLYLLPEAEIGYDADRRIDQFASAQRTRQKQWDELTAILQKALTKR